MLRLAKQQIVPAARAYSTGKPAGGFDVSSFIGRIDKLYKDRDAKKADSLVEKLARADGPRKQSPRRDGNAQRVGARGERGQRKPEQQQEGENRDKQWTGRVNRLRAAARSDGSQQSGSRGPRRTQRAQAGESAPIRSAVSHASEERVDLHLTRRRPASRDGSAAGAVGAGKLRVAGAFRRQDPAGRRPGARGPRSGTTADAKRKRSAGSRPSRAAQDSEEQQVEVAINSEDAILAVRSLVSRSRTSGFVVPGAPTADALSAVPVPPVSVEARVWSTVHALGADKTSRLLDSKARGSLAPEVLRAFTASTDASIVPVPAGSKAAGAVHAINGNATMSPAVKQTLASVIEGRVPVSKIRARA